MKKNTVLVVDDEEIICEAIAFDLNRNGVNVLTASNGNDAWNLFIKNQSIDLIITDVRMPDGDGVNLLDKIRAHDRLIPVVIFITGFKDISDQEAYKKGVNGILSKPFKIEELMVEIQKYLSC